MVKMQKFSIVWRTDFNAIAIGSALAGFVVQIKKLKFDEFVLENREEGETIRFEFVK